MPSLPDDLFTDDGEAPRTDSCRPFGIPFDRRLCPPDDHVTDLFAALAADIDAHCIGLDDHEAERGSLTAPGNPPLARRAPLPGHQVDGGRGDWWNGVPL